MTPLDRVLARLDGVVEASNGYSARCPAHDDRRPSLTIKGGRDGVVLLSCMAGCRTEDVLAAIGLGFRDLWPRGTYPASRPRPFTKDLAKWIIYVLVYAGMCRRGATLSDDDVAAFDLAVSKLFEALEDSGIDIGKALRDG